jgi:hypothetical protein
MATPPGIADLRLYLLGTPRIEYQGRGVQLNRRKALALVAHLALAEQPQSRDLVATLLWSDLDQVHSCAALCSTLPTLTNLVPWPWLGLDRMALALNRGVVWVGVDQFRALLASSRSHGHSPGEVCEACAQQLSRALALTRQTSWPAVAWRTAPDANLLPSLPAARHRGW